MRKAVVFDVGRVLFEWQLAALFEKLIDDRDELDWFLAHVVTEEWHFEHDRGRNQGKEQGIVQNQQHKGAHRAALGQGDQPLAQSLAVRQRLVQWDGLIDVGCV